MERTNSSNPLVFKPGGLQTILMENILCLKVIWEKQTAGEHVLSQNQHDDYEELCDSVREPKGWGAGAGGGGACLGALKPRPGLACPPEVARTAAL